MEIVKEIIKRIILIILSFKILYISKKFKKNHKNLFIDLGTNRGQGFKYFKIFFPLRSFDYLLVEPNPNLKSIILNLINELKIKNKVSFINKAAHISNSSKKLFGLIEDERGKFSDGASIISEHNSKMYASDNKNGINVETFDIVEKLREFNNYDNVIIKMDIEGSEYDVLEHILSNICEIKNIKHIFVEFHSRFMKSEDKSKFKIREGKIIKALNRNKINFTTWI